MSAPSQILRLNLTLLHEWAYRFTERAGMMCEDRVPSPLIQAVATAEANQWLENELAYEQVNEELPL